MAFGIIEPAYFTNPVHVDVARLTHDVYKEHDRHEVRLSQSVLSAIVKGYLGSKRAHLWKGYRKTIQLIFEDDLGDKQVILTQAVAFAREQRWRTALVRAEKDVNNRNYDAALKKFQELKGLGAQRDLGIEYWRDADDPSRWREDRRGLIGSFFLRRLDLAMGGGLGAGELGIILAGGKVGKSTLLGRFAAGAVWQNKTAAIATGELSGEKYRKRIDAMTIGIPSYELTRAAYADDAERPSKKMQRSLRDIQERMRQARQQMKGNLWIKQWPTNKGKIRDIEVWLDQLEDHIGKRVDILYVDYIRVFKPNTRFEEHRLAIGEIALDLRGLAVERDIPVWTAQQANRPALKKERLEPSDLAEDISAFWTLDFLLALCQTEQERGSEEARKQGKPEKARIALISARDVGQGGTFNVSIHRDTFTVREAESKEIKMSKRKK